MGRRLNYTLSQAKAMAADPKSSPRESMLAEDYVTLHGQAYLTIPIPRWLRRKP